MKVQVAGRHLFSLWSLGLISALLTPDAVVAQTAAAAALDRFLDARTTVYQAGSTEEDLDALFALFADDASYELMPGASLAVLGTGSDLANLRQTLEANGRHIRSAEYTIEQRTASSQLATGLVRWSFEWERDGTWEPVAIWEHLVVETVNGRIQRVIQHGGAYAQR